MFDIGWTEILVIAIVAIVVIPSKDLPRLLRTTGQMIGRVRRMAGDFQSQFNSALREAEREVDLADARKQVESIGQLNPMNQVRKALDPLRTAGEDMRKNLTASPPATAGRSQFVPPAAAPVPPPAPAPSAETAPSVPPEAIVEQPAAVAPNSPLPLDPIPADPAVVPVGQTPPAGEGSR
jgi:sec-independent protein translocase protein TatB